MVLNNTLKILTFCSVFLLFINDAECQVTNDYKLVNFIPLGEFKFFKTVDNLPVCANQDTAIITLNEGKGHVFIIINIKNGKSTKYKVKNQIPELKQDEFWRVTYESGVIIAIGVSQNAYEFKLTKKGIKFIRKLLKLNNLPTNVFLRKNVLYTCYHYLYNPKDKPRNTWVETLDLINGKKNEIFFFTDKFPLLTIYSPNSCFSLNGNSIYFMPKSENKLFVINLQKNNKVDSIVFQDKWIYLPDSVNLIFNSTYGSVFFNGFSYFDSFVLKKISMNKLIGNYNDSEIIVLRQQPTGKKCVINGEIFLYNMNSKTVKSRSEKNCDYLTTSNISDTSVPFSSYFNTHTIFSYNCILQFEYSMPKSFLNSKYGDYLLEKKKYLKIHKPNLVLSVYAI